MKDQKISNILLGISGMLFLSALALPGFYTAQNHQPHGSFGLLLTGWLGMLTGNFTWLANPFYLAAFVINLKKPWLAIIFCLLSLLFAFEFYFHEVVLIDEGGGKAVITAYGWGYYLWIMSVLTLLISTLIKWAPSPLPYIGLALCGQAGITYLFLMQFYVSPSGQYALAEKRDFHFDEFCRSAGEKIHSRPGAPVLGIYFDARGFNYYDNIESGRYSGSGGGEFSDGGLKSIPFVERNAYDTKKSKLPFTRKYQGSTDELEVSELESNYFVKVTVLSDQLPRELDVDAKRVLVYEKGKSDPIAESSYVVSGIDRKFCGMPHRGRFDESEFAFRSLGLIN